MPSALVIIPARMASQRLPGKMLADIAGRPMIYWTWRQARRARTCEGVFVATGDHHIADVVRAFGGAVIMTSRQHHSGTERVCEAARSVPRADIIVNVQGDEPLISPAAIDATVRLLSFNRGAVMATAAVPFRAGEDMEDPDLVKLAVDHRGQALSFSRTGSPLRSGYPRYLRHIGVYAFRRRFLFRLVELPPTSRERKESLEQLRALENGHTILVATGRFHSISVDTKHDLERVRRIIAHG